MATPIFIASLDASSAGKQVFVARGFRVKVISNPEAILTTSFGSNADLTYEAKSTGTGGNAITVAYVVGAASTPLSVSVSGNAITVNLATNAGAAATDTVGASGTPASVRATGTITTSSTGAANNDTATVGATTYTFKTALTGAANEVLRTGVIDVDLTNLASAINASAGSGTTYGTGTVANASVTAGSVVAHVLTVTAKSYLASVGNAIALAKTGVILSVSGANLSGGTNENVVVNGTQTYTFVEALDAATANEVLINGQDGSLTNLAAAINGAAGAGTTYGTGTVANTSATAGAVVSHAITLTAITAGSAGNSLTLSKNGSHLSVGAGTFSGGGASVAATSTATQVQAAVRASSPANALVAVSLASGQNGSGTPAALSAANLAGGTAATNTDTGAVISGAASEVALQPGVVYQVDIDDDEVRKTLSRHYLRWIEVPGGDIHNVAVASLILSEPKSFSANPTGTQSFVSRGTPVELQEIGYVGTDTEVDTYPGAPQSLDLTLPNVRRAIRQHREQIISCAPASANSTLVTIRGLVTSKSAPAPTQSLSAGRGFRISKYGAISSAAGASNIANVTSTTNVQVDLSDFNVRRALRRNVGRYIVISAP